MTPPLLAFGFANLAILGWLGAAAAPILIHLWMRRVRKETRWAAIRFLEAAIKRHARRLQLQQWILLAIRTAIILLVVLAASKPMLDSLPLAGPGVRTHRMLVIDTSMSMGLEADDGPLIDRAKRLAVQLIDLGRSGDVFSVATLASPPRVLLGQPTSDRARAKQAVQKVELTEGSARLPAGLAVVRQVLSQAQAAAEQVDRHEITFLTDLTAVTWEDLTAGDASNDAGRLYAKLIEDSVVSIVDVGQPEAANHAVVEVRVDQATPTTQRKFGVRAKITRFGGEAEAGRADLLVDGVTVASEEVDFGESHSAAVTFAHRIRTPGAHTLSVRIADDRLAADDQRWAACNVVDHVRVLCVEGRRGAARYLASALNPSGKADAPIKPRVVSDASLAGIDFSDYQCVLFCNVAQFSRKEADRLGQYVRRGGGAVFFLGDRVVSERYNEVLGRRKTEGGRRNVGVSSREAKEGIEHAVAVQPNGSAFDKVTPVAYTPDSGATSSLLPARIGQALSAPQFRLDPLEYAHPIVAPFRGRERAGLITSPIARYFQLQVEPESPAQVALATTGGDPLVVTSSFGRGRVVLVATPGSLSSVDPATGEPWTVLPAWPSFLPIVRELLNFASGEAATGVLVGETISGVAPSRAANEGLVIRRPRGDEEPITLQVDPNDSRWSYGRTDRSGVYQLASAGVPAPLVAVAVNPDPRESDLRRVVASRLPAEVRLKSVGDNTSGAAAELATPTGIHRGLLLTALALVLVETFLAYWFGRAAG